MMTHQTRTKNSKDTWETPQYLIDMIKERFGIKVFDLDPCATSKNTKGLDFITKAQDGLYQSWSGYHNIFINPPFNNKMAWIEKILKEQDNTNNIFVLLPVDTSTNLWYGTIFKKASFIYFFEKRVHFLEKGIPKTGTNFATALIVFSKPLERENAGYEFPIVKTLSHR